MSTPEFICCTHRHLPPDRRLEGAWYAAILRPENAPAMIEAAYVHPHDEPLPPEALTGLRSKFWPNGRKLNVGFLGGNPELNARVLRHANKWSQYANISFISSGNVPLDIIAGYGQAGYWSYIGTDCGVLARQDQQTLNLQGFDTMEMPDSEWDRVVPHEFGHALGLLHEQVRFGYRIDRPAAHDYFWRTQRWPPEMVDQQMPPDPPGPSTVVESPDPDEVSIMEYAFPAEIMVDRRAVPGGTRISAVDIKTIALIYPGRGRLHPHLAALAAPLDPGLA